MSRNWQPGRDVRGAHMYLAISDDVRVIRRGEPSNQTYEVAAWDSVVEQWAPVPVREPVHTATLAIAAAKRYARAMGQETAAVR